MDRDIPDGIIWVSGPGSVDLSKISQLYEPIIFFFSSSDFDLGLCRLQMYFLITSIVYLVAWLSPYLRYILCSSNSFSFCVNRTPLHTWVYHWVPIQQY